MSRNLPVICSCGDHLQLNFIFILNSVIAYDHNHGGPNGSLKGALGPTGALDVMKWLLNGCHTRSHTNLYSDPMYLHMHIRVGQLLSVVCVALLGYGCYMIACEELWCDH